MANKIPKLYDDLYYEIFNLITDWILTNNIHYTSHIYDALGYFPVYDKDDINKVPCNWFAWRWQFSQTLFDAKLEEKIDDEGSPYPLAILEDEKLSDIHYKIIIWCERHRLHLKFNKPKPNRKRCYRPTQYRNAKYWLRGELNYKLWKWKKENNIHHIPIYID